MADKSAALTWVVVLLTSLGLGSAAAQGAASQTDAPATLAAPAPQSGDLQSGALQSGAAQADAPEIGVIPPVFPPRPPAAAAMSVQCEVPAAQVAKPFALTFTTARIESGKGVRVLAMGTSAFWSVSGASSGRNYPSRVGSILEKVWKGVDVDIVNRGVSGEIASVSAKRLINEAAMLRPTLVLWQLGTNDAVARVPVDEFEQVVRSTVRLLRENRIDVILVGLQYTPKFARDAHYFEIRAALDRIAAEEKILLVRRDRAMEFIAQTRANSNVLGDDDFNLVDLGYPCMAEHIAQAVVANIFVRRKTRGRDAAPGTTN